MNFKKGDLVRINDPELKGAVYEVQNISDKTQYLDQYAYFTNGNFCNVKHLKTVQNKFYTKIDTTDHLLSLFKRFKILNKNAAMETHGVTNFYRDINRLVKRGYRFTKLKSIDGIVIYTLLEHNERIPK